MDESMRKILGNLSEDEVLASAASLLRMENDEDIKHEALASRKNKERRDDTVGEKKREDKDQSVGERLLVSEHPFTLMPGTGGHRASAVTRRLLSEVGGVKGLGKFTTRFYEHAFQDPHIALFIRDNSDPHGVRFAAWIAEKFGDIDSPWSTERSTRKVCPFSSHGHSLSTPHDRSSAHYAAWHSPKRERAKFGRHFKLDDCRIWMRLHFLALRESGLVERSPAFTDYYVRFIGHFVSVYERSATLFARESFRWSADRENVRAYLRDGRRRMRDSENVLGRSAQQCLAQLPPSERSDRVWPYPRAH